MSNPYLGEIRMFAGNFAPVSWAICDGSLLSIAQNEALFALIGTTYGGDGVTSFGLPNLQSRVPVHVGSGFALGQAGGAETVTLTAQQLASHSHAPQANTLGTTPNPSGAVWGSWTGSQFSDQAPAAAMSSQALQSVGGGQPHDNMLPFLALNFIICLAGIYPTQA